MPHISIILQSLVQYSTTGDVCYTQKSPTRRTSVNRSLIAESTDAGVQQECQPADAAVNTSFSEHSYSTTESPRKLKRRLDETDY